MLETAKVGHRGESNEDLKALIAEAEEFAGNGFLLPTRNSDLMRWCFDQGLRIIMPLNLMSRGLYQETRGVFLPSVLFIWLPISFCELSP